MVYILIIVGMGFIIFGIYKEKENEEPKKNKFEEELEKQLDLSDYELLEQRIWDLEKKVYNTVNKDVKESDSSNMDVKTSGFEKYMLICKYEKDGYQLDEICDELNLNEGEVLLLKNLYKDYLK